MKIAAGKPQPLAVRTSKASTAAIRCGPGCISTPVAWVFMYRSRFGSACTKRSRRAE